MSKINLTDDDVVSVSTDLALVDGSTATGAELMEILSEWIYKCSSLQEEDDATDWVKDGVDCKVLLVAGGKWQKGKIRLRLEFVSDKPISSVDDLVKDLR